MYKKKCENLDCFANSAGACAILTRVPNAGECSFAKSPQQLQEEQQKSYNRLKLIKRYDLIDKYHSGEEV